MNWQQNRVNWKHSSDKARNVWDVLSCIGNAAIDDSRRRFGGQVKLHRDTLDDTL